MPDLGAGPAGDYPDRSIGKNRMAGLDATQPNDLPTAEY
jgi:hypothetical protein